MKNYRFFAWNFSYFSAKARAYLRYKASHGAFEFEEILASADIMGNYLMPATGTDIVPQIEGPDGEWLQDTSAIIDALEDRHPEMPVVPLGPRQRLASYLIELLADEWMLPWAFWERWHYSMPGVQPNQEAYNAQLWGAFLAPGGTGLQRQEAARSLFRDWMSINAPEKAVLGPYAGLPDLGVTKATEEAWTASMRNILGVLDDHFKHHDYVLGGRPSLGDFALMGPLYGHLYKDPVPGLMMRTEFPFVCEWIDRCNGSLEGGSRGYQQTAYRVTDGKLDPFTDATDEGKWLADDAIPETIIPLLAVFFDEMWPVLKSSIDTLRNYLESDLHISSEPLPGRSFLSPPDFKKLQSNGGPLTHEFEIRGVREYRMVSPYQVWMLGRLSDAMSHAFDNKEMRSTLEKLVKTFRDGEELLNLPEMLAGSRLRREFDLLYVIDG